MGIGHLVTGRLGASGVEVEGCDSRRCDFCKPLDVSIVVEALAEIDRSLAQNYLQTL